MAIFYDQTIMLLGPGNQRSNNEKQYLEYRRSVKVELIEMGYKRVVIMEDVLTEFGDITLDDKFRRIVNEYDPALFVAFFHKCARMDGVTFEIGWLCSYYHPSELEKRLLVFNEEGFDWNKTTRYIPAFFPNI